MFLRKWWSEIFYLIQFNIPSLSKSRILFFVFFSLSTEVAFTDAVTILGAIQRFLNVNKTFSHKLDTHWESTQKAEPNPVYFRLIWRNSFFLLFFHFLTNSFKKILVLYGINLLINLYSHHEKKSLENKIYFFIN